ncbi:Heparanase-like protein 3 [Apostasia shenzhenica]|uniref:Heparanase-like protein 3 n=1 Tax=Apostasia shenzhenica TaxID=1088818 RepID=A0A2I0B0J8_9ASPA|nr:Heparanase-like protein 3 [Apostasia shenzhenica]
MQNLSNPIFLNAIKAFSPLKLRLGGSLQDKLIYETGDPGQSCRPFVKNDSEIFNFTQGCLPIKRWDQLNEFFHKTGAIVIFGLNALNGRVQMRDGSLGGPWNYTNAESLIRYSVDKGYNTSGWELGNELSGTGIGYRIRAARYAADVISLKSLVDQIYQGNVVKPLVLAPGAHYFDKRWFSKLINNTKASSSLDVLTLHLYNLGPSNDSHLVDKILDPSYLDKEALVFSNLSALVKNSGTSVTAWIGEAGGAYNSGRRFVSDSFVDSFCDFPISNTSAIQQCRKADEGRVPPDTNGWGLAQSNYAAEWQNLGFGVYKN